MRAFPYSAIILVSLCQPSFGTVVVVDGEFGVVAFQLPGGTPYQIDYPTTLENVWFDRARTDPALPLTTYTARSKGDINGDGNLDGVDIDCFLTFIAPQGGNQGCEGSEADFNGDSQVDESDVPDFVEALVGGYPPDGAVLYVEGLSASTNLGDAAVDLLTDPDMDTVFTVAGTEPITVFELTLSPLAGPIGTSVTISLSPAIPPLAFDAGTSIQWSGQFEPLMGQAPPPFQVSYSPSQVHEQSTSEAIIIVGDGTATNVPDATSFGTNGQVLGTVTINLNGRLVRKDATFGFQLSGEWRLVDVDDDELRSLGDIPEKNYVFHILESDPDFSLQSLPFAYYFFRVFLLRVDENATTLSVFPATLDVTLVATDLSGNVIDQVPSTLIMLDPPDGDPDHIIYHSSLDKPVILVDNDVDKNDFPELTLLKAPSGSAVFAIP